MGYRGSGNSLKGSFICHQEVVEVKQQNPWRHSIWEKQYASLAATSQIRNIKYWLGLLKLNQDRLPFGPYRCFQNLAERGKVSWAGRVKELLLRQGFGEVWYNQGVGDEKKFLRTFFQYLKDCFGQSWHDKVESNDRFLLLLF